MAEKLTDKQLVFVGEYLTNGHSYTKAAAIAYACSDDNAKSAGHSAMTSKVVRKEIDRRLALKLRRFDITEERIIQELACIAFFDFGELLDEEGRLKDIDCIPEHTRRAIASLEIHELFEFVDRKKETTGYAKKFKVNSKEKALELLGKQLGMFKEKVEHEHKGSVNHTMKVTAIDLEERINQLVGDKISNALQ